MRTRSASRHHSDLGRSQGRSGARRHVGGWAYLVLIFIVLAIATTGLAALENIVVQAQRDREAELLEIGRDIRQAIGQYYEVSPGAVRLYPAKLEDLMQDERFLGVERHLRRIRPDPFTGAVDWDRVISPQGGIQGVASRSRKEPFRKAGFDVSEGSFASAKSYADWKFVYQPRAITVPLTPGDVAAGPKPAQTPGPAPGSVPGTGSGGRPAPTPFGLPGR